LARTFAAQESLPGQNGLDDRQGRGNRFDAHPVANARKIGAAFNSETEPAREFRQGLVVLVSHNVGASINGHDPCHVLSWLEHGSCVATEPLIETERLQIHGLFH
ncbi:MAG: hypothetical protein V2I57_09390, partial [Xanthomonadales bacterium]|nr:hypothetical protein [Xanthomonadales bacterium]